LVSAAVRLVPLGQTAGQRILASLQETVIAAGRAALERPLDDIGSAAPLFEWASMKHETQYTRLFRS
jgi:urease accessory protein